MSRRRGHGQVPHVFTENSAGMGWTVHAHRRTPPSVIGWHSCVVPSGLCSISWGLPRTSVLGYHLPPLRGLYRNSHFGKRSHFFLRIFLPWAFYSCRIKT